MLNDLKAQAAYEAEEMERLKAEGREKSATCLPARWSWILI